MKKTNATQLTVIMLGIQWSIALPAMAINESDISVVTPVQTLSDFSVSETPQTVFTSFNHLRPTIALIFIPKTQAIYSTRLQL
jgi:hypothetical protein